MFGLSFGELFAIGIVALIVIGPERLPKVARTVGHLVGRAQRYVTDIKSDIRREMDIQELSQLKSEIKNSATEMKSSFEKSISSLKDPFEGIQQELGDTSKQLKQELSTLPDLAVIKPAENTQSSAEQSPVNQSVSLGSETVVPNKPRIASLDSVAPVPSVATRVAEAAPIVSSDQVVVTTEAQTPVVNGKKAVS